MESGRINVIAGGGAILLAGLGAFVLGFTMEPHFEKGFYAMPYGRSLLRAGHTHGMPFALYNLIVGMLLTRSSLGDRGKKWCSILALGSLIMPVGLILRGLQNGAMTFAPVAMIGATCFLASAVLLILGARGSQTQTNAK